MLRFTTYMARRYFKCDMACARLWWFTHNAWPNPYPRFCGGIEYVNVIKRPVLIVATKDNHCTSHSYGRMVTTGRGSSAFWFHDSPFHCIDIQTEQFIGPLSTGDTSERNHLLRRVFISAVTFLPDLLGYPVLQLFGRIDVTQFFLVRSLMISARFNNT